MHEHEAMKKNGRMMRMSGSGIKRCRKVCEEYGKYDSDVCAAVECDEIGKCPVALLYPCFVVLTAPSLSFGDCTEYGSSDCPLIMKNGIECHYTVSTLSECVSDMYRTVFGNR